MNDLPKAIAKLCRRLGAVAGVEAIALGGSRATGTADPTSDWDIGVFYRGDVDFAPLAGYGDLHPPGSWGRIMNGGAWLSLDGMKVDVLLRDLGVVLYWTGQARLGLYEVDALLGYLAGVPTYSLTAELALSRTLIGCLPVAHEYPDRLVQAGARRWRLAAEFSVSHALMRAERGDVTGAVGQAAKAVIEIAHAVGCRRRMWVLNEKKLIEQTGLQALHALFADVPRGDRELVCWVAEVRAAMDQACA